MAIRTSPSPAIDLPIGRRFEHDGYAATAAGWTHEARLQTRQREVRSARANQSVEVKLLPIDASPHGPRALAIALGAPHVHPPAEASRYAQGLDFHENESGTKAGAGQALSSLIGTRRIDSVRTVEYITFAALARSKKTKGDVL